MSIENPVYSKNPLVDALQHIGHEAHIVFNDGEAIADRLPTYIAVTDDALADAPTIISDVSAVATAASGGFAIWDAVLAAVATFGTNPAADLAALTAIVAQATNGQKYLATLRAAMVKLLTDLKYDANTIEAVLATKPSPAQGS